MRLLGSATLAILLFLTSFGLANGKDIDELDARVVVADLIVSVVRPSFADLESGAAEMSERMRSYCLSPSPAGLVLARQAFDGLVVDWGKVEFIRLGPLSAENRHERLLFWPDRRGRGLKQVRDIIRLMDKTAIERSELSHKSVAVQGLLALEFALFAEGAEADLVAPDSYRCAYAATISEVVLQVAAELNGLWQADGDSSFSEIWLNPAATNSLFRDEAEQFAAVLAIFGDGLEIVLHQRLDPFLRDSMKSARPKSALFWRSGNTISSLRANLDGFNALLSSAKLQQQLEGNDRRMIGSLNFELGNAMRAVSDMNGPIDVLVSETATYDRLNYLRIVTGSMMTMTRDVISPIFGLSSGFSSLDGD